MKHLIAVLVLMQIGCSLFAQSTYQLGGLSSFNLNKKLKNDWSVNTKIESRKIFQRESINGTTDREFKYILTDLSLIVAKRVGLNSSIGGGHLIRVEGDEFYNRFIQQYVIVQKLPGWRLAHRIMSDQTFSKKEKTEIRLRYRIISEIPLSGKSVDPREFYLKLNNEYVNSFQTIEYDLEIRLNPLLGFDISNDFKIESGLDYRINSFLSDSPRHSYWMTFNLFVAF